MALSVHDTTLRYLGLVSLREVKIGNVAIYNNRELCHVDSFNWTAAKITSIVYSLRNADESKCRKFNMDNYYKCQLQHEFV